MKEKNDGNTFGCFMIGLIFFIVSIVAIAMSDYLDKNKGAGYILSILIIIAVIWYYNRGK